MRPLRVVLVTLEAPLPFGHVTGRWSSVLLRELVARGHRVTAFAACGRPADIPAARDLFPAPKYDLRLYPHPARRGLGAKLETLRRPFSYMFSADLKADLARTLAGGYDVLHLDQLPTGWLAPDDTARSVACVHYLYDIDLAQAPPVGIRGRVERQLMRRTERRLLNRFRHLTTLTDRLTARVRQLAPRADVTTTPFGLDPDRYPFIRSGSRAAGPVVSVIGNMNWYPSHSAAVRLLTRLWPGIKARVPAARAQVVGWGARARLRDFLGLPGVEIAEDVPDIRPYFERTGVLLYAPGRGSGMKIKVLEAFAFGVPVVTTAEGVEGIPAEDGVHAGVCDDDAGLIDRAVGLLADPARQDRQRAAARALVEASCGPGPTTDAVERVYAGVTGGGR